MEESNVDMVNGQKRDLESTSNPTPKKVKSSIVSCFEYWLGFRTMNNIAKFQGMPKVRVLSMEDLKLRGMSKKFANDDIESLPSFPYVAQEEWP